MESQIVRSTERTRKPEGQRRDAASTAIRFSSNSRDHRTERLKDHRHISMNRIYLNDLYERSSI